MSIQTEAAGILRSFVIPSLTDAVTITEPLAKGTLNQSTGQIEGGTESTIYTGAALVRPSGGAGITSQMFGEEQIAQSSLVVVLPPTGVSAVDVGQTVTVDTALLDLDLVGKQFTIRATYFDSYETMRVALCGLNQGGGPSAG